MPNIQAHLNFANRRGIMNMNLSKSDTKSGLDILKLTNISWMRHMLVGRLKKDKTLDDLNNDGFFKSWSAYFVYIYQMSCIFFGIELKILVEATR